MFVKQSDLKLFSLIFLAVVLIISAITIGAVSRTTHKLEARAASSSSAAVSIDKYIVENTRGAGDFVLVKNVNTGAELKLHCTGSIDPDSDGNATHHEFCYDLPVGEVVPLEHWNSDTYVRKKTSVNGEDDYEVAAQ